MLASNLHRGNGVTPLAELAEAGFPVSSGRSRKGHLPGFWMQYKIPDRVATGRMCARQKTVNLRALCSCL